MKSYLALLFAFIVMLAAGRLMAAEDRESLPIAPQTYDGFQGVPQEAFGPVALERGTKNRKPASKANSKRADKKKKLKSKKALHSKKPGHSKRRPANKSKRH